MSFAKCFLFYFTDFKTDFTWVSRYWSFPCKKIIVWKKLKLIIKILKLWRYYILYSIFYLIQKIEYFYIRLLDKRIYFVSVSINWTWSNLKRKCIYSTALQIFFIYFWPDQFHWNIRKFLTFFVFSAKYLVAELKKVKHIFISM